MTRAALIGLALLAFQPAHAISAGDLNSLIDSTNFVVDGRCSGTLIDADHGLVLTNYHCIQHKIRTVERDETQEDGTVKTVRREERRDVPVAQHSYAGYDRVGTSEYLTEIIAAKERWDLALLQFKADETPFKVDTDLLPEGEPVQRSEKVYAVGNPRLLDASVSSGVVASVTREFRFPWTGNREVPMIQFDAPIAGGSSGGSLYNDDGYMIGIPSAGYRGSGNLNLAIPIDTIYEFLAETPYNG